MKKMTLREKNGRDLLKLFENGKLRRVKNPKAELTRYQEAAKFTTQKVKSINIRLSEKDLTKIKTIAVRRGLLYQTFITSVLHQVSDRETRV
jgi:predicted DNA binding CopG/RHH family protein